MADGDLDLQPVATQPEEELDLQPIAQPRSNASASVDKANTLLFGAPTGAFNQPVAGQHDLTTTDFGPTPAKPPTTGEAELSKTLPPETKLDLQPVAGAPRPRNEFGQTVGPTPDDTKALYERSFGPQQITPKGAAPVTLAPATRVQTESDIFPLTPFDRYERELLLHQESGLTPKEKIEQERGMDPFSEISSGRAAAGAATLAKGAYQALTGKDEGVSPEGGFAAGHEVIAGAMQAGQPLFAEALAAKPLTTLIGLGAGLGTGKLAEKTTQKVGGSPEAQQLANDVGFFIPSMLGTAAGLKGSFHAGFTEEGQPIGARTISAFGDSVAGGYAQTPEGINLAAKVGPYKAGIRLPFGGSEAAPEAPPALRPPVSELEARSNDTIQAMADQQGAQQFGAPQPNQGPQEITPQVVQGLAKAIVSLPAEHQGAALIEAQGNLSRWMISKGSFINPLSGKLETVTSEKQADALATKMINDHVEKFDAKAGSIASATSSEGQGGAPSAKPEPSSVSATSVSESGASSPAKSTTDVTTAVKSEDVVTPKPGEVTKSTRVSYAGREGVVNTVGSNGRVEVKFDGGTTRWMDKSALGPAAADVSPNMFVARHGLTEMDSQPGKKADYISGWSDVKLIPKGVEMAHELGKELVGKGITEIVSSDLPRAKQTAGIISQELGGIKVTHDPEMRSWNYGNLTGKEATPEVKAKLQHYIDHPDETIPGGESYNHFRSRFTKVLEREKKLAQSNPERVPLLLGHSNHMQALDNVISGGKGEIKSAGGPPPASAIPLKLSGNNLIRGNVIEGGNLDAVKTGQVSERDKSEHTRVSEQRKITQPGSGDSTAQRGEEKAAEKVADVPEEYQQRAQEAGLRVLRGSFKDETGKPMALELEDPKHPGKTATVTLSKFTSPEVARKAVDAKINEVKYSVEDIKAREKTKAARQEAVKPGAITKQPWLTPEQSVVESKVSEHFTKNLSDIIQKYIEQHTDENGTLHISSDDMKQYSPEGTYGTLGQRLENSDAVHPSSAMAALKVFDYALAEPVDPKKPEVVFVSGIQGAGKSTLRETSAYEDAAIVFERDMSRPETSEGLIQKTIDSGRKPVLTIVTVRDPNIALGRALKRAGDIGRSVNVDQQARIYSNLPKTAQALKDKFGDALAVHTYDVSGEPSELVEHPNSVDAARAIQYSEDEQENRERLQTELDRRRKAGNVSAPIYRNFSSRIARGEGLPSGGEGVQEPQGEVASSQVGQRVDQASALRPDPKPGEVGNLPVVDIRTDPNRFQYKLGTDAEGVTAAMKGVDFSHALGGVISIWKDPADGRFYVVNGHHRLERAQSSKTDRVNVYHMNVPDATEARALGAMQNIAEGRGTALDAAKFIRDSNLKPEDFQANQIPLAGKVLSDGLALSRLDDGIFNRVVQQEIPPTRAVAIGAATPDHAEQRALLEMIERKERQGKHVSAGTIAELARRVTDAPKVQETTQSLFGDMFSERSTALEEAKLSDYARKELLNDRRVFGYAGREATAQKLSETGNKLEVSANQQRAQQAQQAVELYDRLSTRTGPIADALREGGLRLAQGENAHAVKRDVYQRISASLQTALSAAGGERPDAAEGLDRAGGDQGAGAELRRRPQAESDADRGQHAEGLRVVYRGDFRGNRGTFSSDDANILRRRDEDASIAPARDLQELSDFADSAGKNLAVHDFGEQTNLFGSPDKQYALVNSKNDSSKLIYQRDLDRLVAKRNPHVLRALGQSIFPKQVREAESEVEHEAGLPPVVWVNQAAKDILDEAIGDSQWTAVSVPPANARQHGRYLGGLANKIRKAGEDASKIYDLQSHLQEAERAGPVGSGVVIALKGSSEAQNTLRALEEQTHAVQRHLGGGWLHDHTDVDELYERPEMQKALVEFGRQGYDTERKDQMVAELAARIMTREYAAHGLTKAEAIDWYVHYLQGIAAKAGTEGIDQIRALLAKAREKIMDSAGDPASEAMNTVLSMDNGKLETQVFHDNAKQMAFNLGGQDEEPSGMGEAGIGDGEETGRGVPSEPGRPREDETGNGEDIGGTGGLFRRPDGLTNEYVTVYHGTTPKGLEGIRSSGHLAKGETGHIYVSSSRDGAEQYLESVGMKAGHVIPLRVRRADLMIDNRYPDGSFDARIKDNAYYKVDEDLLHRRPAVETERKGAIEKLYDSDLKPAFEKVTGGLKEVAASGIKAFFPRLEPDTALDKIFKTAAPREAIDALMQLKGERDRALIQFDLTMAKLEKFFDKLTEDERIGFVDHMKLGEKQETPALNNIASGFREVIAGFRQAEKLANVNLSEDYLSEDLRQAALDEQSKLTDKPNYFPVRWEKVPGHPEAPGRVSGGRRPLEGSKAFTKQATLPDMSTGIALGGEPISTNPVKLLRARIVESLQYTTARNAWNELKHLDLVQMVKPGEKAPDGYSKIDDPIARKFFPAASGEGMVRAGEYYGEANTARLLNNFLSRDRIRETAFGRGMMMLKNISTALELSLSPMHAIFESLEAISSQAALGGTKMWNQGVRQGSLSEFAHGMKDVLASPLAPYSIAKAGAAIPALVASRSAIQAPDTPSSGLTKALQDWKAVHDAKAVAALRKNYPDIDQLVDDMITGGMPIGMHHDFQMRTIKSMREAWGSGNPIGAFMRSFPAGAQAMMAPLFQYYIPALKYGMFLRNYTQQLSEKAADLESGKTTREQLARRTVDSVENRFGEMNFDNLFMNRTLKTALQFTFRSVTWKLGEAREFSGALAGQTRAMQRWIDGFREDKDGRPTGEKLLPELDPRFAWLVSLVLMTVALGTVMSKALSGKWPWEHADKQDGESNWEYAKRLYVETVHPRMGEMGANGKPARISLPTYWKDVEHFSKGPSRFVVSSLSTTLSKGMDIAENRDFFGNYVYNRNAPLGKQLEQVGKYAFPEPFVMSNYQRGMQQGEPKAALLQSFGFPPASKSLDYTPAEKLALSMQEKTPHTPEEVEGWQEKKDRFNRGEMTHQELMHEIKRERKPWLLRMFEPLTYADADRVYEKANAEERSYLSPALAKKRQELLKTHQYGKIQEVEGNRPAQ